MVTLRAIFPGRPRACDGWQPMSPGHGHRLPRRRTWNRRSRSFPGHRTGLSGWGRGDHGQVRAECESVAARESIGW